MDYKRMASEYLEEVARIDRRLEQLRRENRAHREADLWVRMGALMEIRDDLQATAHVLQRRELEVLKKEYARLLGGEAHGTEATQTALQPPRAGGGCAPVPGKL